MTWPPPPPDEAEVPHRPWDPKHPSAPQLTHEHERLVYMVVDEIVEDWIGISISSWPHADQEGRLRFLDPDGAVEIGTTCTAFHEFVKKGDPSADEPRIGSTLAARARKGTAASLLAKLHEQAGHGEARVDDLGDLFEDPVDLTKQGRLLAKLACYGAMLSKLPSELEERWNLAEEVEQ